MQQCQRHVCPHWVISLRFCWRKSRRAIQPARGCKSITSSLCNDYISIDFPIRYCENDLLTKVHNGAGIIVHNYTIVHSLMRVHTHTYTHTHTPSVYTQRLTHIQQVVCGPVIQTLESQLQHTQSLLSDLKLKKTQLKLKVDQELARQQQQKNNESEA